MRSDCFLRRAKKIAGLCAVFLGFVTIVGTSVYEPSLGGTYIVLSDCPGSSAEGKVDIQGPQLITSPTPSVDPNQPGKNPEPIAFGFPTNDFSRESNSGASGFQYFVNRNESRSCVSGPMIEASDRSYTLVFICRGPNNEIECTISLRK